MGDFAMFCEHCPNPHKEDWPSQCRFSSMLTRAGYSDAEIQEWIDDGCHGPCEDDESREYARDNRIACMVVGGLIVLSVVLALLWGELSTLRN
jgi:hypothetical protein